MDWAVVLIYLLGVGKEVSAYLINTVLVVLVVRWLTAKWPMIKEKFGFLIPILAPIIGLAISTLATTLSGWLGYPIDFSAIVAIITGTTAVWGYQLVHQFSAKKREGR